jgi:UTP--glucose-1-phosphate uridylyltransferase
VGDEPFALLLPDMLHHGVAPCLRQMMDAYEKSGGNVVAVYEVPDDQTHQYGITGVGAALDQQKHLFPITHMVEKPAKGTSPSNLAISGRYILQPEIFSILETQAKGAGGEIQITDAMITLAKSQDFFAYRFDGEIYDCGSKLGFLSANIAYALARPDMGDDVKAEIKRLLARS